MSQSPPSFSLTTSPDPALNAASMSQLVLRLPDAVAPTEPLAGAALPPEALAAMRRLVGMVQRLRSPGSGWQSDQAPTPENLALYVSEEAYDVLETLRTSPLPFNSQALLTAPAQTAQPSSTQLHFLESLTAQLLWGVARSAYPTMQLIEGIPAHCCLDGNTWSAGMMRLVVVLEASAPAADWSLDLATRQPPPSLLPAAAQLRAPEYLPFGSFQPVGAESQCAAFYLKRIAEQIQLVTPSLGWLESGTAIDWLQPGQPWQSGKLQLRLGFEFVVAPAAEVPTLKPEIVPDLAAISIPSPSAIAAPTVVRLADPQLLAHYTQLAIQQPLYQFWQQHALTLTAQPTEAALLPVVTAAYYAVDRVYGGNQFRFCLAQPQQLLDELMPRLLWLLTSSTHEVMMLVGGIAARVLQPAAQWQVGMLRLAPLLELKTTQTQLSLDLATQAPAIVKRVLKPWAIAQAQALPLCAQAIEVATLCTNLRQQICNSCPELMPLFNSTPIEQQSHDAGWQPGTLQLHLSLEFVPAQPFT